LEHLYPEDAWRRIAVSSPMGSRLGTASWRALASSLRVCVYPGSIRASDAATCLAGRAANTMTAGRSVSTRTGHRHLTFCDRETSAFASAAVRLALLSRDRGSLHRAVPSRRDESPLCRICLRDHPRAPPCFTLDPRWVHTALGQVRCEPVSCERLRGFYAPFADRRRSVIRASFRFARVCEQRPGYVRRTPRGRPCVACGTEIPEACAPAISPGPSQRFRASPAAFASREGGCSTLRLESSPATRTHPVMPPREGSAPPDESEVLSADPHSGERALPVALPDGVGVGARGAFCTRQVLAP
jgi:hypothetical protein